MRVTLERSLRVTVLGLVAGEVPDDESLVSGTRQEHVGAGALSVSSTYSSKRRERIAVRDILLHGGGQAGDPAILQDKLASRKAISKRRPFNPVSTTTQVDGIALRWENSTYVALESALEDQLFGHCNGDEVMQRIKVRGEKGKVQRLLCKT